MRTSKPCRRSAMAAASPPRPAPTTAIRRAFPMFRPWSCYAVRGARLAAGWGLVVGLAALAALPPLATESAYRIWRNSKRVPRAKPSSGRRLTQFGGVGCLSRIKVALYYCFEATRPVRRRRAFCFCGAIYMSTNRDGHIRLTSHPGRRTEGHYRISWGAPTARERGPVITAPSSGNARNAIGAHGGSYSVYRALAISAGALNPIARPDLTNTSPVVDIGPFPQWSDPERIVSLDPWGHRVASDFQKE